MFGAYRRDEFGDPDSFLVQLGMVLERYSDDVIRTATSPVTGIQRKSKFPPSIAEVVEFCDAEQARIETMARLGPPTEMRRPEFVPRVNLANVFVPADNPRYQEMVDRSATAHHRDFRYDDTRPGIWVVLGWMEVDDKPTQRPKLARFTADDLRAIYARQDAANAD